MSRAFMSLIIVSLLVTSFGSAQPRERMKQMMSHRKEMREGIMDDLKLNDEQKSKMKKLHNDLEKKQIQTSSKIRLARLDMKELFGADKPDRGAIEKQVKLISELQLEQKLMHVDHMFSVNALLTSDQQKVFREHMSQMGEGPGGRMMRRGHRMNNDEDEDD